ncbi:metal ABC transporter ATP-binding protein [Desulfothermus okinawensis JCM 13304]
MDYIVKLEEVFFTYGGNFVLEDVNLSIEHGDFLAIFGPNGGGKTTLLKLILGLIKPTKGTISYNFKKKGRPIGYLPQTHYRGDFPIKVIDLVLMGLVTSKKWGFWFSKKQRSKAEKTLELVDMLEYKDCSIKELSGGQLQRVYLARALISEPELLILDEPTSNIDPQARFCFYDFLGKLGSDITLVMVSHDLSLSVTKINKIACVNKRLIVSPVVGFNKEMLSLIFGEHLNHSCPVTPYYMDGELPVLSKKE